MKIPKNISPILLFLAAIASLNCGTKVITIDRLELGGGGSLLNKVGPLKVLVNEFNDKGIFKDNIVGLHPVRKIATDRKVGELVTQSIINELRRNGHYILEPKDSAQADIVLGGTVDKFGFQWITGYVNVTCKGNIETDIVVKVPSLSVEKFEKRYKGFYETSVFGGSYGQIATTLNEALLDLVQDFTADVDLMDYLKKVKIKN